MIIGALGTQKAGMIVSAFGNVEVVALNSESVPNLRFITVCGACASVRLSAYGTDRDTDQLGRSWRCRLGV